VIANEISLEELAAHIDLASASEDALVELSRSLDIDLSFNSVSNIRKEITAEQKRIYGSKQVELDEFEKAFKLIVEVEQLERQDVEKKTIWKQANEAEKQAVEAWSVKYPEEQVRSWDKAKKKKHREKEEMELSKLRDMSNKIKKQNEEKIEDAKKNESWRQETISLPQFYAELNTVAKVVGLVLEPQLNGQVGTLRKFNAETGRYELELSDRRINLLPQNTKLVAGSGKSAMAKRLGQLMLANNFSFEILEQTFDECGGAVTLDAFRDMKKPAGRTIPKQEEGNKTLKPELIRLMIRSMSSREELEKFRGEFLPRKTLGPITSRYLQKLKKNKLYASSFPQVGRYLEEYWGICSHEAEAVFLFAAVMNMLGRKAEKLKKLRADVAAKERDEEHRKKATKTQHKKKVKKKKGKATKGKSPLQNLLNQHAAREWELHVADDLENIFKNPPSAFLLEQKPEHSTAKPRNLQEVHPHPGTLLDAFIDKCVKGYGDLHKIRFTKARCSSSAKALPSQSSEDLNHLCVRNSVLATLEVHLGVLAESIEASATVASILDSDSEVANEQHAIESLCAEVLLRVVNNQCFACNELKYEQLLGMLVRVPTFLSGSTVADRCHALLPDQIRVKRSGLPNGKETLIEHSLRRGSKELVGVLLEASSGKGLALKHVHAAARWMSGGSNDLFVALHHFYPVPAKLIAVSFTLPIPAVHHSEDVDLLISSQFEWFVLGSFDESGLHASDENKFVDTASAFASMEKQTLPASPFAFCSLATLESVLLQYSPGHPGHRSDILQPALLLVSKQSNSKPTAELVQGSDMIFRWLSCFENQQPKPQTKWVPYIERLLNLPNVPASDGFDMYYEWLKSLELPVEVETIRGLRGRSIAHMLCGAGCDRWQLQDQSQVLQLQELIKRSSPTACDVTGQTPLHVAARHGNVKALEVILDGVDDPSTVSDLRTKGGLSALHFAAKFHHLECVRLLLSRNHDLTDSVTKNGRTAAMLATAVAHHERAAGADWQPIVDELICAGSDPLHRNTEGESLLSIALACTGLGTSMLGDHFDKLLTNPQLVDQLRIRDSCIHGLVYDCTGITDVQSSLPFRRLRTMLELGADANRPLPKNFHDLEPTPLHCASSAAVIELLLSYEGLINKRCGDVQWTPLHSIVSSSIPESAKLQCCQALLLHGAEYQNTALSRDRKTPMDLAQEASLRQLFADESQRRRDNYEEDMARHKQNSAHRLSFVQRLLARDEANQRVDIETKISKVLDLLARSPDPVEQSAHGIPGARSSNEIYATCFDASHFEIFLSKWAIDSLFVADTGLASFILTTLQSFATANSGENWAALDSNSIFVAPVMHSAEVFVVGEMTVMHSSRTRSFHDAIRIWSIEQSVAHVDKARRALLSSIQNGLKSRLCTVEGFAPWADASGTEGNTIIKLFRLTDSMAQLVQQRVIAPYATREFSFSPAAEESEVMHKASQKSSALVLGRSGTGKTSILLDLMFQEYSKYCTSSGNQPTFNQMFVTCNVVLVNSVRKSFQNLHQGAPCLQPLPEDDKQPAVGNFPQFLNRQRFLLYLDSHLPKSFFRVDQKWDEADGVGSVQSLDDQLVKQQLLGRRRQLVDRLQTTLGPAERAAVDEQLMKLNQELREQKVNLGGRSKQTSMKKTQRGQLIDYEFFSTSMWPTMVRNKSKISPSAVYTEIVSHITGSVQALDNNGELPEKDYLGLPKKVSPLTRADAESSDEFSRKNVYALYEKYKALKVQLKCWDTSDLVTHIYQQVKQGGWPGPEIHRICADEVQDFTQAECALMVEVCADSNNLFFCGDTAQTISRVGFRFEDLKQYFHRKQNEEQKRGVRASAWTQVPEVLQLSTNFRSHDGVLRAANAVVSTIINLFPGAIDLLSEECGAFDGVAPLLLPDKERHMLSKFVKLTMGTEQNSSIAFGANQVVIVRTLEAKVQLPAEFQSCLVLTVAESKGLEFNDVLLYNFFSNSSASLSDWAAVLSESELDLSQSRLGHHRQGVLSQPRTDAAEIMDLCEDLKQLYVALTRARRRVIIFDDSDARIPMFELLERRQLATVATLEDIGPRQARDDIDQNRGDAGWIARGKTMMEVAAYEEAVKCFRNGPGPPGSVKHPQRFP
jgi:superfamily I DNA/RNA helicase